MPKKEIPKVLAEGEATNNAATHSLESLGISNSAGILSIELDGNYETGSSRAIFNPSTRRWQILRNSVTASQYDIVARSERRDTKLESAEPRKHPPNIRHSDWTDKLPKTDFVEFFKGVNWGDTPLGPAQQWGPALQLYVNSLLVDTRAAVIYWGPLRISIHNDIMRKLAFTRLQKKTDFMGVPFADFWPEILGVWSSLFECVRQNGFSVDTLNVELFPTRAGGVEETFFSGTIHPLKNENGEIEGFYNCAAETTKETIRERRALTSNAIAVPSNQWTGSVWDHIFTVLIENPRDFPLAFAYSVVDDFTSPKCSLQLQKSLGVPSDHIAVPSQGDLYEGKEGFMPYFRKAKAENQTILLRRADKTLPLELIEGFEWQGFGEPSNNIAITPIFASDRLISIFVIGLNPRRPYDSEYESFMNNLTRQLSAVIIAAVYHEETRAREARLNMQLEKTERQIRNLAEYAPMGLSRFGVNGVIQWANDQFYEISGHKKDPESQYELSFIDIVLEEDQATSASLWPILVEQKQKVSSALRMKRKWTPPSVPGSPDVPVEENAWILASAYPVIENGEVTSIGACITDISTFKWAELVQTRSAAAAKEAKRLQENFIDVVSHEMRNPLSAITHLAESIESSLEGADGTQIGVETCTEVLENNVEAARVILLCAQHQKRIIDDVLTLSKLDSLILSITPIPVQPSKIIDSIFTMFEAEFENCGIKVENVREPTWEALAIDWQYLDPSRLTQILINLVSNSIKFTRFEKRREIKIRAGASLTKPPDLANVTWFPSGPSSDSKPAPDLTLDPEWGQGQQMYLVFAVQDTGKGLKQEEMDKLFNRFQQANPKTYITYGGSGLGLFISRELTELQGGEIGVTSSPKQGSTFAFYIKSRRAEPPAKSQRLEADTQSTWLKRRSTNLRKSDLMESVVLHDLEKEKKAPAVPGLHILLVEDNIVNQTVLAKQLRKAGCTVNVANNGIEALEFIQKTQSSKQFCMDEKAFRLDVVLMDVEMPLMNGLSCARKIRQLEVEGELVNHLPIVAITANARSEQMDRALEAGMDDVQSKPFGVAELLERVKALTERLTGREKRGNV